MLRQTLKVAYGLFQICGARSHPELSSSMALILLVPEVHLRGAVEDRDLGALEAFHFLIFTLPVSVAGAPRTGPAVRGPGREGRRQGLAPSLRAVGTAIPDTRFPLVSFSYFNSSVCASSARAPRASWCPLTGPFYGNYGNSDSDNKIVFTVSMLLAFPILSHSILIMPFEM